ncbi:hypothetical protein HN011_008029 [Eciton burchellii]|nr:hypothetical protein HN011_008029 [Eciton burchellii]
MFRFGDRANILVCNPLRQLPVAPISCPLRSTSQALHTGDETRTDVQSKRKISVNNLDIFAYVNSKFVYVEKHIKNQLNKLYMNIMEPNCSLEKQILQNALSLSITARDEIAFRSIKTTGYTAVTAGQMVRLIKCIPNRNQTRYTKRLQRDTANHVQDPRLLVPVDAETGRNNTSTKYSVSDAFYMEIREPSIPCHKRNLLDQRSRTPPEPHHVPRGKYLHVKHHSKRSIGTTHTTST